jgi:hypothetical protein
MGLPYVRLKMVRQRAQGYIVLKKNQKCNEFIGGYKQEIKLTNFPWKTSFAVLKLEHEISYFFALFWGVRSWSNWKSISLGTQLLQIHFLGGKQFFTLLHSLPWSQAARQTIKHTYLTREVLFLLESTSRAEKFACLSKKWNFSQVGCSR